MREKHLRLSLSDALPLMEEARQADDELYKSPKTRSQVRTRVFGRPLPARNTQGDVEEEDQEEEEEEDEKKGRHNERPAQPAESQLEQMRSLLARVMHEMPAGCIKADIRERWERGGEWKALVEAASTGHELAALLVVLEESIASGWLGRPWVQQRESWIQSCTHDFVPLPMFALLLYMLEFAVDRFYNPKTGKSERPAARTHDNSCAVCNKGGQLLMCDRCPNVYHMECCTPPLAHIPRGTWVCEQCVAKESSKQRRLVRGNPTRATRSRAVSYNVDEMAAFAFANPVRSTRNQRVNYSTKGDDDEDDEDVEDSSDVVDPELEGVREQRGRGFGACILTWA